MRLYVAAAVAAIMITGTTQAAEQPTGVDLLAECVAEAPECQNFLIELTTSYNWPDRTLGIWISGIDKMQWSLCPPGHTAWSVEHWRDNLPGLFVDYWTDVGDAESLPAISAEQAAGEAMGYQFPGCARTSAS